MTVSTNVGVILFFPFVPIISADFNACFDLTAELAAQAVQYSEAVATFSRTSRKRISSSSMAGRYDSSKRTCVRSPLRCSPFDRDPATDSCNWLWSSTIGPSLEPVTPRELPSNASPLRISAILA